VLTQLLSGKLQLPPEMLLRAYLDLIHTVFVELRGCGRSRDLDGEYVYWLGNAMHNISSLIAHYDQGWLDDAKFRELYLRPFDERWRGVSGALQLEAELDEFIRQRNSLQN